MTSYRRTSKDDVVKNESTGEEISLSTWRGGEVQDWLVKGNELLPFLGTVPSERTTRISRYQGKLQLLATGILSQVVQYVDGHEEEAVRLGFYDSEVWVITDKWVKEAAEQFSWTQEQLQQMFDTASKQ